MTHPPTVAICQSRIILGGRLQVIVELIELLNRRGIVPDVLTAHLAIRPEQIPLHYGRSIQARFRRVPLPRLPKVEDDFNIVLFNIALRQAARGYDLWINSSNSLFGLPPSQDVLTYMFFPRRARLLADVEDIHHPERPLAPWSVVGLQRRVLRQLYRLSRPHPRHRIVCMTRFTRTALRDAYPTLSPDLPVVYPPVPLAQFGGERPLRRRALLSAGRFSPDKRQLEQLALAREMPDLDFHLVGFVGHAPYFEACQQFVQRHALHNVHLHPDAPFEKMVSLMQEARYFLHTTVNEPFGLTCVQAMAAGCIPLVHDSGGQRETVPEPTLRYTELSEVPALVQQLEEQGDEALTTLRHRLQQHIRQFETSVFHERMGPLLAPLLEGPG